VNATPTRSSYKNQRQGAQEDPKQKAGQGKQNDPATFSSLSFLGIFRDSIFLFFRNIAQV
jgi:hypothetical protein